MAKISAMQKPTRRSFLITTGLTALASTRILGANDTLRVGVIGAGRADDDLLMRGQSRQLPDRCGQRLYGPRLDAIKQRANGGSATFHANYKEVLEQPIDAVFIAAPDHGTCAWLLKP